MKAIFILATIALAMPGIGSPLDPAAMKSPPPDGVWRILPIGDSITEGGSTYSNWRLPLWEKLTAAGHFTRFVGTRNSKSRIGPLAHEGHGGKNAEFLSKRLTTVAKQIPADVVLLHAGHNHFAEESPVAGIIAAHESIIASCRAANPDVAILVAQVIPSSKLPKYSYIPELNQALSALAGRLHQPGSPVLTVDQAAGFDPRSDTIADGVHPNASGAAKMAERWFQALHSVLPPPGQLQMPRLVPYKETEKGQLLLHVFAPSNKHTAAGRPAVVFFFGGGWSNGTPLQFYPDCRHFAALGYVAISADYRISSTHGTSPFDAVADARSVIRHIRAHAGELGVDPARITAAGASAGGHLAAATACIDRFDDPADDRSIDARPNALVLWYPVIDNGPGGYGNDRIGDKFRDFSPLHNIRPGFPPTLVFLGTRDKYLPVATGKLFQQRIRESGARCELKLFPDAGHPIYGYRSPDSAALRNQCLDVAETFLKTRSK